MKKFAGNLITFLCALGILWILVSWADVIAHNISAERTVYEKQCFRSIGIFEIGIMNSACRISVRRTYRSEGK